MERDRFRELTSADGITHQVPIGISYMRDARMWRVTFAVRRFGQQYFSASDPASGLVKAIAELVRRREAMRRAGSLRHTDQVERDHKAIRTGRPGVMFNWRSRDRAFFEAKASSVPYGKTLRFPLRSEECVDSDVICRLWALAVATRDYLVFELSQGRGEHVTKLTAKTLPEKVRRAARMVELTPAARRRILGDIKGTRPR